MITTIDEDAGEVVVTDAAGERRYPLATAEGFAAVSRAWLRAGWDAKYVYSFSWLGRPIIQLPEDLLRIQEVVWRVQPDVIIETGVAHGGSLVFYAALLKAIGRGRVIGIDVDIRPHNREAIEAHPLSDWIALIEGSSIDPATVGAAGRLVAPGETVMVILDANHRKDHVLAELRSYGGMVTIGSYIVAADGIMGDLVGAPRTGPDWTWNNPREAVRQFVSEDARFAIDEPAFPFNEGAVRERVTYWPQAFLRRVK